MICVRGVYTLTSITTSVTVNLVLSIRKFLSLTFSVLYFHNPFTLNQTLGSLLVFLGTFLYSLPAKKTTPPQTTTPATDTPTHKTKAE